MRLLPKTEGVTATAIAGLAIVGYLIFLLVYYFCVPPDILSIATVQTERVSFEASDGRRAAFYIGGMQLSTDGTPLGKPCVTGIVTPVNGAMVTYSRVGNGTTEIKVVASPGAQPGGIVARLDREGAAPRRLASPVEIAPDENCTPSLAPRLPIWGRASIGQEFQPQASVTQPDPSFLIAGNVTVWAKAAFNRPSHYAVGDLTLPVGSRLEADSGGSPGTGAVWWGVAYADPVKPGLAVDAATESRQLELYRPYKRKADVVEVSWITQLTKDPFLEELHFVIFALAGLIGFLVSKFDHPLDFLLRRVADREEASTLEPITSKIGQRRGQDND